MFGVVTVIMLAIVAKETEAYWTYNTGRGMVYGLGVTQDTTLAGSSQQLDYLQYLLVSKFPQYENKRSLVQFENLPNACGPLQIISAKMYLYYVYAHKASWQSIQRTPFIPRFMQVPLYVSAISRKIVGKSARDNTDRYCGWFSVHFSLKIFERMALEAMDVCLRVHVLKESNKSKFDSYSVINSVSSISHIFRDCRLYIFSRQPFSKKAV